MAQELLLKLEVSLFCLGDDEQSAGGLVEPVHDERRICIGIAFAHDGTDGIMLADARHGKQSGGLVYNNDVIVFEDDGTSPYQTECFVPPSLRGEGHGRASFARDGGRGRGYG